MIDPTTFEKFLILSEPYLVKDRFFKSKVCSLYYDTPDSRIIRNSIEKPVYKEKLRMRSYGTADKDSGVFLELKKKYMGVVYKRRIETTLRKAEEFVKNGTPTGENPQIEKEIQYFLNFYEDIAPAVAISCERLSFAGAEDPGLRITFDSNVSYRTDNLTLANSYYDNHLLDDGTRIMEIKIPGSMPLWLSGILDELMIFPTSYSKYASAYINETNKIYFKEVCKCV